MLGTASDTPTTRCSAIRRPWPAADNDLSTAPNFDGPVRQLLSARRWDAASIEFASRRHRVGTSSGTAVTITTPITITVTGTGSTKSITVNNLGKILLQ